MKTSGQNKLEVGSSESPRKIDIASEASRLIGSRSIRYVGPELGDSPEGFDCSGFIRYVLKKSGFVIPDFIGLDDVRRTTRHVNELWDHYGVNVQSEPEANDLVFFSRHGLSPTHVGIMSGADKYIHSPGKDGTVVTAEHLVIKSIKRRTDNQRQLYASNPIGFKAPTLPLDHPYLRYHQRPA